MIQFKNFLTQLFSRLSADERVRIGCISFIFMHSSLLAINSLDNFKSLSFAILFFLASTFALCAQNLQVLGKFASQGALCGAICGLGATIPLRHLHDLKPQTVAFCAYMYTFGLFHFSEFLMIGITNINNLSADSFLLNHSRSYWIAAFASWVEHWSEYFLFPDFYNPFISLLGIFTCATGEVLRKLAMCHARAGFTHQIQIAKHRNHVLITNGIYGIMRHPGYLGWLLWSVGTQMILCNPLCIVAYACITYGFFKDRINEEEKFLIEFFGQKYINYKRRVYGGIPGIS